MHFRPAWWIPLVVAPLLAGCADPLPPSSEAAAKPATVAETGVVHEYDFYLAWSRDVPMGGKPVYTMRYTTDPEWVGGSVPGPEIRVRQGDTVRVNFHDGWHTIHWHGVRLPWAMDGVPDLTQAVEWGTYTYEFVAKDAGTFWYHCHVDAPSHIDWGMFGALIVEPADPSEDPPFDREVTLFLHELDSQSYALADWTGDPTSHAPGRPRSPHDAPEHARASAAGVADGSLWLASATTGVWELRGAEHGYRPRYDTFMINGKQFPDTDPIPIREGETVRIRIVNAGQLTHAMHLHGHRFLVTHKDGALLPAPYLADTIGLFPGERYDVYVTGDNPGHWDFHDHGGQWGVGAYAASEGFGPAGMQTMLVYEDWTMPEIPRPVDGGARAAHHGHGAHGAHAPRAPEPVRDAPAHGRSVLDLRVP